MSDPFHPITIGSFNNGCIVSYAFILDDIAFLSDDRDGLEIVNISDLTDPYKIGGFNDGGHTRNLFVKNNLVFLIDIDEGLEILELSARNPSIQPDITIVVVLLCSIPIIIGGYFIFRHVRRRNV